MGPWLCSLRTVFKKAAFPWEGPRGFQCHCNIRPQQPKQFFRLPLQGRSEAVEVLVCCKASKIGSARQESGSTLGMKVLDGRRQSQTA